jgi:hypothetical protein
MVFTERDKCRALGNPVAPPRRTRACKRHVEGC